MRRTPYARGARSQCQRSSEVGMREGARRRGGHGHAARSRRRCRGNSRPASAASIVGGRSLDASRSSTSGAWYEPSRADQIDTWSRRIREKNLDELVTDVQRLARRQPAVFIGSAFAVGLLAARFLKSSRPENDLGDGDQSHRARDGGGTRRSAASDSGAPSTVGADAEVAIGTREVSIPDGLPVAYGSRRPAGDNSGARSIRTRKSSSRTEKP
jgi:hypothetical protein